MSDIVNDFRTNFEKKRGWWIETRATVPCNREIAEKDGGRIYANPQALLQYFMKEGS